MNRTIQLILSLVVAATVSGCASAGGYWKDRGRDAADIFTCAVGTGIGMSARVGPVSAAPLLVFNDMGGLRGGHCFWMGMINPFGDGDSYSVDMGFLWVHGMAFFPCDEEPEFGTIDMNEFQQLKMRGKVFRNAPVWLWQDMITFPPFFSLAEKPKKRGILSDATYPAYFYTQAEVVLAVGGGMRLGANPGELVDFLLGFATVDIFDDDLAAKARKKAAEKNRQDVVQGTQSL